jgi:CBS domain-containing protein
VNQLLKSKRQGVETIEPTASVFSALKQMAEKEIGSLIVTQDGKMVGLFSERDYARNVILKGRSSKKTQVREIMSSQVIVVNPKQTTEACMAIMTEKRVRHLPVIQNNQLVGIISIGDLVKAIIEEQQFVIEQLVSYISS